jgi:hypothetical protein
MKTLEYTNLESAKLRFEQERAEGLNAIMYYSRKHQKYYVVRGSSFLVSMMEAAIAGAVGAGHLVQGAGRAIGKGVNIARQKIRKMEENKKK